MCWPKPGCIALHSSVAPVAVEIVARNCARVCGMCKKARTTLGSLELNADRFVELMRKLIGEAKGLQNNPSQGFVPRENAASDHVLELLRPHTKELGGPLEVERIEFTEGRGNVVMVGISILCALFDVLLEREKFAR